MPSPNPSTRGVPPRKPDPPPGGGSLRVRFAVKVGDNLGQGTRQNLHEPASTPSEGATFKSAESPTMTAHSCTIAHHGPPSQNPLPWFRPPPRAPAPFIPGFLARTAIPIPCRLDAAAPRVRQIREPGRPSGSGSTPPSGTGWSNVAGSHIGRQGICGESPPGKGPARSAAPMLSPTAPGTALARINRVVVRGPWSRPRFAPLRPARDPAQPRATHGTYVDPLQTGLHGKEPRR